MTYTITGLKQGNVDNINQFRQPQQLKGKGQPQISPMLNQVINKFNKQANVNPHNRVAYR